MKSYTSDKIRNVVVLGHSGSGKTSLVEAILNITNVTTRLGTVEEGNTVSDYHPQEIERGISIKSSVIPIEWQGTKMNFIDTPGAFDYAGEVIEALEVADMAVIVVNARTSQQVGLEKAWAYVNRRNLPRMLIINGMDDAEDANFDNTVDMLREEYGKSVVPFQEPYFTPDGAFKGFISVITGDAKEFVDGNFVEIDEMPENKKARMEELRSMLIEIAAESDDELLTKFFDDEPFSIDDIYHGLNIGIKEGSVTPVLCSIATQKIGVEMLLNTLLKAFPSSRELNPTIVGRNPETLDPMPLANHEDAPFSALVFKTMSDPYLGRVNFFRVMSGTLRKDDEVYNVNKHETERVSHLYILRGKERIDVKEVSAGDIGAVARLDVTETEDTLATQANPVLMGNMKFPEPLYAMAIVPKGKGDEDKISGALSRILEEDLTLKHSVNSNTRESLIWGISDQHLDMFVNNLKNSYNIDVDLVDPVIEYKETIKSHVTVDGRFKRQSGGHGQYGDVKMEFEPSGDMDTPYIFEEKIFGGAVPRQYFSAVEKGIDESVEEGVLAGYPVIGIKATLIDGSHHPVDSSDLAFKMAASLAFKDGMAKANPTILEPIAKVTVTVPDTYTGDIMGDINRRRGRVLGMNPEGRLQIIEAYVPMAEMQKYTIDLRSMTQGRGEYTIVVDRYEEAPHDVQERIIAKRKAEKEE